MAVSSWFTNKPSKILDNSLNAKNSLLDKLVLSVSLSDRIKNLLFCHLTDIFFSHALIQFPY